MHYCFKKTFIPEWVVDGTLNKPHKKKHYCFLLNKNFILGKAATRSKQSIVYQELTI